MGYIRRSTRFEVSCGCCELRMCCISRSCCVRLLLTLSSCSSSSSELIEVSLSMQPRQLTRYNTSRPDGGKYAHRLEVKLLTPSEYSDRRVVDVLKTENVEAAVVKCLKAVMGNVLNNDEHNDVRGSGNEALVWGCVGLALSYFLCGTPPPFSFDRPLAPTKLKAGGFSLTLGTLCEWSCAKRFATRLRAAVPVAHAPHSIPLPCSCFLCLSIPLLQVCGSRVRRAHVERTVLS
jgi:hypothetical protein